MATWLRAKGTSERTRAAYAAAIERFRAALRWRSLDLDSAPGQVALVAATWAAAGDVAPSTVRQRLAILSSFYVFCERHELLAANPIRRVARPAVQPYATAEALDPAELRAALAAIERRSRRGKRDFALLAVALVTGRRRAEVAGMVWGDVRARGGRVVVTWPHCKGGKVLRDALPAPVGEALLAWGKALHGLAPSTLPAATPVWVSLAHNGTAGRALSPEGVGAICRKHLQVNFHALRHTFARAMEDAGARESAIQARLGHSSLEVTGRYLARLRQADNPHAADLVAAWGLDERG